MIGALRFAILAAAVVGSPAIAQSTTVQLPPADMTAHSVPPAPPPERRSESPPPFPPMSRTAPHHARGHATHETVRTSHHRILHHEASTHTKRHGESANARALSKRDKNERFCAALSHRKAQHNSTCRKLEKAKHEAAKPHQLTKQEKKDERRCSGLSLRQVMRDSKCRKVAERQLESSHDRRSGKPSKHRHESARKAGKHHESTKTRSRASKHHSR